SSVIISAIFRSSISCPLPPVVPAKKILWRTAPQVRAAGRDRPVRECPQHRGILQAGVSNNAIAVPLAWLSDNHQ
ncbi:MAG: hypothetical protein KKB48_00385, partial [Gammaproteobacteria bacterium]|nr:hypothetical protein [Gammaproteobacteria bacterium]